MSLLVLSAIALFAEDTPEMHFHSLVPLGSEAYQLQGEKWKGIVTVLGSAENPEFEGMVRREIQNRAELFSADGERMRTYPERIAFRITASYRTHVTDPSPFPFNTSVDMNDYLLCLRFRVVVFHGLRQTVVHPEAVEMIGMPGEVPYDERIYRVTVNLEDVPLTDRVVLEVRDGDGERVCKFHLDLI
jgi:hypothetical protein